MAPNVIPNPTSDLSWDSWDGAIHEIFEGNALKHPDRWCVTETTPLRCFSYREVNEASNVLAHYFHETGLTRGDVVMIYAFRNVDLVVAIMGVLKSGATFSVLDPAYPPDRQIIYLDVSRPKGLVVIKKAKGGGLSHQVQDWIDQNLSLKATVPALEIHREGFVKGGFQNGQDILESAQHLKDRMPGITVGPDSNPTLSFTSGSEGKPKGVLGRHFSLVYYQLWMATKFGLSSNDKFTMLSGISHDPIQRDIFTTLFLGAQLIIPSPEDIQHGRLAEWMKEWGCTVTHLTPAMGQIFVGGADTQIPTLRNAFFVGDILIKRDVRKLQDLAPNCQAINMFGTTETQRAVSYYLIPSRDHDPKFLDRLGDKIPAGKGMHDVQLLVVDRQNPQRICNVGEQGEIYVRASGLAEGYLGLDDITDKKFVDSWFVDPAKWKKEESKKFKLNGPAAAWRTFYKGPRDRLYRSGDLGHYTSSGDVECTGRADNQVKIRGFRIELGEIDSHLSQHPLVRENVTLVRRDKDEEHTLVSYVIPELSFWPQWLKNKGLHDKVNNTSMNSMLSRFSALREELREYLKTKLPQYAVPGVIVPLNRMPLNPNGKVDKPALPFPNPEELTAALPRRPSIDISNRTSTEKALAEIWSSVLDGIPSKTISPDDSFFDIGAHSLTAQRMFLQVRRKWGQIDIMMQSIYDYPTLRGFAAEIDRALDPQGRILNFKSETPGTAPKQSEHYSLDATQLAAKLPKAFISGLIDKSQPIKIFLTGSTGFLGTFIIQNLLKRKKHDIFIIAHVRAKSHEEAFKRIHSACVAYGVWSDVWRDRLKIVLGDLQQPRLGLSEIEWESLKKEVDIIIANGATVHWVSPYSTLRAANVESTRYLIELAAEGKHKQVTFVSSTSTLGTDHFVQLSRSLVSSEGTGILESDDLQGSMKGLDTGYGQTKWVSEYLMREAGRRGLVGCIVRPAYVLGDSNSGVTVTDDFLVRMLKGCVQLQSRPNIHNTINMVPVDHVAHVVSAAALHSSIAELGVVHVTSHPRLTFNDFLGCLEKYGYKAPKVDYTEWSKSLDEYVARQADHALLPLLHFVQSDLPAQTKAVELDDRNAVATLREDARIFGEPDASAGSAVTEEMVGKYLNFLTEVGFLERPTSCSEDEMPVVRMAKEQRDALKQLSGRGAVGP